MKYYSLSDLTFPNYLKTVKTILSSWLIQNTKPGDRAGFGQWLKFADARLWTMDSLLYICYLLEFKYQSDELRSGRELIL